MQNPLEFFMGRTLLPFRPALDLEIATWKPFKRCLSRKDQQVLEKLFRHARHYADAGSLAGRPLLFEPMFFSILLGQRREAETLQADIDQLSIRLENLIRKYHEI